MSSPTPEEASSTESFFNSCEDIIPYEKFMQVLLILGKSVKEGTLTQGDVAHELYMNRDNKLLTYVLAKLVLVGLSSIENHIEEQLREIPLVSTSLH